MNKTFDPYVEWLGIRDPERPVNHYRLLGLELFEPDANVISLAADRQMAHLRNFQAGEQADAARKLLNELSSARLCLLKPERKAEYDTRLQQKMSSNGANRQSTAVSPGLAAGNGQHSVTTNPNAAGTPSKNAPSGVNGGTASPRENPYSSPRSSVLIDTGQTTNLGANRKAPAFNIAWVVLAVLTIFCGGLMYYIIKSSTGPATPPTVAKAKPKKAVPSPSNTSTDSADTTPVSQNPATPLPDNPGDAKNIPQPEVTEPSTDQPQKNLPPKTVIPVVPPADQPSGNAPPELKGVDLAPGTTTNLPTSPTPPENPLPPENSATSTPPAVTPPVSPVQAQRLPVPTKEQIAPKMREIRELFKEEYKQDKDPDKLALAKKLFASTSNTKTDPVTEYVLLMETRDLAVQGGDVQLALRANDLIIKKYEVDGDEERADLFAKLASQTNKPKEYYLALSDQMKQTVEASQLNDEYDLAIRVTTIAQGLARKLNVVATVSYLSNKLKELNLHRSHYNKVKDSKARLQTAPEDPAANTAWGEYLCFVKGNFSIGLTHLALGEDAVLADLAKRELDTPADPLVRFALAEDWWLLSDKYKDSSKNLIKQHAGEIYLSLKGKLEGLDGVKVDKRIQEFMNEAIAQDATRAKYLTQILTSTVWVFTWDNEPQKAPQEMQFFPNNRVRSQIFSRWEIEGSEVKLSMNNPNDPLRRLGSLKVSPDQLELHYYERGKLSNHAILRPR
ncbi:MAG: hypothetical protein SFX18_15990 [Pirellulales bacterium]|nr:hypothetical protein [Pirellulales bacterium]